MTKAGYGVGCRRIGEAYVRDLQAPSEYYSAARRGQSSDDAYHDGRGINQSENG